MWSEHEDVQSLWKFSHNPISVSRIWACWWCCRGWDARNTNGGWLVLVYNRHLTVHITTYVSEFLLRAETLGELCPVAHALHRACVALLQNVISVEPTANVNVLPAIGTDTNTRRVLTHLAPVNNIWLKCGIHWLLPRQHILQTYHGLPAEVVQLRMCTDITYTLYISWRI